MYKPPPVVQASFTSLAQVSISKFGEPDRVVSETREAANIPTNRTFMSQDEESENFVPKVKYSDRKADYKEHSQKLYVMLKSQALNSEGIIDPKKKSDRDTFMATIDKYILENVVQKQVKDKEEEVENRTYHPTQLDAGNFLYQKEMFKIPILPGDATESTNQNYLYEKLLNKPEYQGNYSQDPRKNTAESTFPKNFGYAQSTGYSSLQFPQAESLRVNSSSISKVLDTQLGTRIPANATQNLRAKSKSRLDDLIGAMTVEDPSPLMFGLPRPKAQPQPPVTQPAYQSVNHMLPPRMPGAGPQIRTNSQHILSSLNYSYGQNAQT